MDQFAVLHITKFKSLGGIGAHIDPRHISSNVNQAKTDFNETLVQALGSAIDGSKVHLREEWSAASKGDLKGDVAARISQGYRQQKAIRKDAVLALGVILTGSHERMKEIEADPKLFDAWKKANYEFACHEFGKENIVRFTLHRDEKTPHFHCVFVPITPEGRLSAKHFTDGRTQLKSYQDRYAAAMKPFGLSRGIPRELTSREHITTKEYYREVGALAQKAQEATQGIKRSNLFQLEQVRHQLAERITQLETTALHHQQQARYAHLTNQRMINEAQRAAYAERLREEAQQAHRHIKQEIPLAEFATERLGWRVDKQKSSKRDVVLKHEQHGTLIAPSTPRGGSGHWVFSWANKEGGGTLIDLLQLAGWDWQEINELSDQAISHQPVASLPVDPMPYRRPGEEDPAKQTELAQARFNELKPSTGSSYLEQRGIHQESYSGFDQVKVNNSQAIFKLYHLVENKAHLCSTISYQFDREGNSQKYFQKGLPRGLAVLSEAGPVARIVITESPIDALSWKQLESLQSTHGEPLPPTMYVSTCGNLSMEIKSAISHLFQEAREKGQSVVLARDNDQAGLKISGELAELAAQQGVVARVSIPPPGYKDWNDYLRALPKEMAQEAQEGVKEGVISKEVERPILGFKGEQQAPPIKEVLPQTPAYTGTLLEELAIPQQACNGLKGYEAIPKQITFPLYSSGQSARAQQPVGSYQLRLEAEGLTSYHEAKGTTPGLVVLPSEKPTKSVVITSSPLEIFLHRAQEQRSDIAYISTCGQEAKEIKEVLKSLLSEQKDAQVLLYMGAAEGEALQKQLMGEEGNACNCQVQPPQQAPWHHTFQQVAYDLHRAFRQDQEDWEPESAKHRKGRGRRLRAI